MDSGRKKIEKKDDDRDEISTSLHINQEKKMIVEQIYNNGHSKFCIYNDGDIRYDNDIDNNSQRVLKNKTSFSF